VIEWRAGQCDAGRDFSVVAAVAPRFALMAGNSRRMSDGGMMENRNLRCVEFLKRNQNFPEFHGRNSPRESQKTELAEKHPPFAEKSPSRMTHHAKIPPRRAAPGKAP